MKRIFYLVFLLFSYSSYSQQNKIPQLKTEKYAGIYSFGDNIEKSAIGSVTVYPETDSTILFFIDVCKGAPSYNLGQLYDRLKIEDGKGIYFSNEYDFSDQKNGCEWEVTIKNKILTIKTLNNAFECGFGGNVIADNQYKLKDKKIPAYFIDGHNHKIHFRKTKPENYLN